MPPQENLQLPNNRELPLPANIDNLRRGFGNLGAAWEIFHGNPNMSRELQELIQKHTKEQATQHTPNRREIEEGSVTVLIQMLEKRMQDRTLNFEAIALANQLYSQRERLRQTVENARPNAPERTPQRIAQEEYILHREALWTRIGGVIRRTLQTLDRYVVLRNQFNYPGLRLNTALEQAVQNELAALVLAMERRVQVAGDAALSGHADDMVQAALQRVNVITDELFAQFLSLLLDRNTQLQLQGRRANPAIFDQLTAQRTQITLEMYSFILYTGLRNIDDLQAMASPEAQRKYAAQQGIPASMQPQSPETLQQNQEAARKLVNETIGNLAGGYRSHFDRVLGRQRPGQPANPEVGLLDTQLPQLLGEQLWTENGRLASVQILNALALYRGGVRSFVGNSVTDVMAAILRRTVPFGGGDALANMLPRPLTAEQYRSDLMTPILRQMGLPDGFDFSPEAWHRLQADPVARERFQKAMTSVRAAIQGRREQITSKIAIFERDLDIFEHLRRISDQRHMLGVQPDPVWLARDRITLEEVQALQPTQGPQIIAAYLVLYRQMRQDWANYNAVMNDCGNAILGNINVHANLANAAHEAAAAMGREDAMLRYLILGTAGLYAIGGEGGLRALPGAWGRIVGLRPFMNPSRGVIRGLFNAPGRFWNAPWSIGHRAWLAARGNLRGALNPRPLPTSTVPQIETPGAQVGRVYRAMSESQVPASAIEVVENATAAPALQPEQFAKRLADIQAAPGANFQEQFQSSFRALTQLEQEAAGNAQMLRQIGARRMALIGEMVPGLQLNAALTPSMQASIRSILGTSQPVTTMQELLQVVHLRSCTDRAQIPQLIRALDAAGVPADIRVRLFDTGAVGGASPSGSPQVPSRPSWALRGGRWVLGGAGLALSGYAAYQDTREALRINEWRQRLQNEVPGLFRDAGFIQSPTNPNMYVRGEGADQVQVNLTALFAISDEMLARAVGEVAVSGGSLLLTIFALMGSAVAGMVLLAGTPMLILLNMSDSDARARALQRLVRALPPAILARIPLEVLTQRTPEDLHSLMSLYVREGTGLLNEQVVRKQNRETMESIDRLAFAVVYRYVQSRLAVNPSLLTEPSGDLEQRLWSMRALLTQSFASRAPGSVSFESITQEAGDRALYLLLTSSYARACARWERHLQNPSAADRLLPEEQAELQLRIRALGQTLLPGRAGRTVADEFASSLHPSGDYAAFVQTSPEDLYASFAQTNRLPQLEQNALIIPQPHPNVSQTLNGGIDALMSLQGISGVSVSTVFTRVTNGRREVLPDASNDAHVQHGVETIQVQTEGGYISYFAFLNGRWMWSSPSYPNWVSVRVNRWQTGVTGRDRLNDIAQALTSIEENLSTEERSKALVQAGLSFAALLHDRRPLPQFLQIEPSFAHLSELLTQQLPQGPFGQPPPGSIDSPSSPIAITMMPMNDPPSFTATIGDRTVQYFVQNGLWFWRSATPNAQAYPAGMYPYTVSPGENPSSPQNMHNAIGRVLGRINAGDRSGF